MKKIIRLTERDLTRIVRRILSERAGEHDMLDDMLRNGQTSDSNISDCIIKAVGDNDVPIDCKDVVKENRLRSSIEKLILERFPGKELDKIMKPMSEIPISKCMRALKDLGGEVFDKFLDCVD